MKSTSAIEPVIFISKHTPLLAFTGRASTDLTKGWFVVGRSRGCPHKSLKYAILKAPFSSVFRAFQTYSTSFLLILTSLIHLWNFPHIIGTLSAQFRPVLVSAVSTCLLHVVQMAPTVLHAKPSNFRLRGDFHFTESLQRRMLSSTLFACG